MTSTDLRYWKMTVAYDGTQYVGWQVQPNGLSIQEVLERAVEQITGERTRLLASGRTDAGVHALGQVVRYVAQNPMPSQDLLRALNAVTPQDVSILKVEPVVDSFHPIRDAERKRYRYVLQDGPIRDPLVRHAWHVRAHLDREAMLSAAQALIGEYDFSSFEAVGAPRESSVRHVNLLTVERRTSLSGAGELWIEIEANGFLYNMVRNIVGTLVDIGRGKRTVDEMAVIRDACDRKQASATAPPQGLFLIQVTYPQSIYPSKPLGDS